MNCPASRLVSSHHFLAVMNNKKGGDKHEQYDNQALCQTTETGCRGI